MTRLFVPLDGSPAGELALPWATALARRRNAELVLAQTFPWPPMVADGLAGSYVPADVYDEMISAERESAMAYLQDVRASLAAEGRPIDIEIEIAVREGSPYGGLLDLADELNADTFVMATHGRGGLPRLVLGSVANWIVQHATIPVLLVRADGGAPKPEPSFARLLVPLDGSALAERAFEAAAELAEPGTTVVLLQVVETAASAMPEGEAGTGAGPDGAAPAGATHADAPPDGAATQTPAPAMPATLAIGYLRHLGERLTARGVQVTTEVRHGRPAQVILAAARAHGSTAIVMATHGRSGPARWLLGSVADEVVRHADRPVLLVSARAAAQRQAEPTVGEVMTEVATVRDDESLVVVLRKLLRQRTLMAGVVDAHGDLVGTISERELTDWYDDVTHELGHGELPAPAAYAERIQREPVARAMSRPSVVLDASTPLSRATHLFRERGLARLPVTRHGRLVGVLTRADVLKVLAGQLQPAMEVANPTD
ncbi:MAG: universal stress protein [Chloroflexi bacterium]|nr:universal stress protein [Chloroflexota bacterium]